MALGLTAQASGTDTPFTDIVAAAATQTAASWVLVGLATALVGAAPRMSFLAWPAVAFSLVLTIFGPLLNVGDVVLAISPFYHLPDLPAASFTIGPVLALLAIAAGLAIAGLIGIRQRDIA